MAKELDDTIVNSRATYYVALKPFQDNDDEDGLRKSLSFYDVDLRQNINNELQCYVNHRLYNLGSMPSQIQMTEGSCLLDVLNLLCVWESESLNYLFNRGLYIFNYK